jgi:FkbM family methyltransferase
MLNISLVEASPSLAVELGRRVAISDQRVSIQVLSGLVGKKGGFGMFNFAKEDNQNFVGEEEAIGSWVRTKGSRTLPYLDLTKAAAETPVIDLIKCDIEGSEFDFINTYADLLTKTVRLVVEFHSTFGDPLSAAEALAGMGFHHRAILRDSPETPVFYFSRA